jgi:hypothetical protein
MIRALQSVPLVVEIPELSDEARAANTAALAESEKNVAWWNAHAEEVIAAHPGKFICVAGQELFVGDDPAEVMGRARTAHPHPGRGYFSLRLPTHQGPMIHAIQRVLGAS